MPSISVEYVIGLAWEERGEPQALLVLGTTTKKAEFFVGFSTPNDAKLEPVHYDVDKAHVPANLSAPAGSNLWAALFEFTAHPSLQGVRFGLQGDQLELRVAIVDQDSRIEEVSRTPVFYIGRSGYGCAVGALFVHGIGSHQRGETLAACGEPIISFIRDWFEGVKNIWIKSWSEKERKDWIDKIAIPLRNRHSSIKELSIINSIKAISSTNFIQAIFSDNENEEVARSKKQIETIKPRIVIGDVAVDDAALASQSENSAGPAHAEVSLRSINFDGEMCGAQLVLAESWWTNSILAPSFRDLFNWAFIVVPMMLALHASEPVRRAAASIIKKPGFGKIGAVINTIAAFIYLLAAMALAIPVEVLLAALFVIGILPIPQLREIVLRMQQTLVGSVGQSYVLVSGPMRLAAMSTRINQDLRWLCQRCRTVVIVAHSQGAAVVYYALQQEALPQIKALYTLGSGIKQLEILRQENRHAKVLIFAWVALLGPAMVMYSLLSLYLLNLPTIGEAYPESIREYILSESDEMLHWALIGSIVGAILLAGAATVGRATWTQVGFWINAIERFKIRWIDFYASRDPVPNGPLDNDNLYSVEVDNFGSLTADHVTYWRNTEQVVAPIALDLVRRAGLRLDELTLVDGENLSVSASRRHRRVGVLKAARWTAILSAGSVLLYYFLILNVAEILPLLTGKVHDVNAWFPALPLLIDLAEVFICYRIVLMTWNYWTTWEVVALNARSVGRKLSLWAWAFFTLWGLQSAWLLDSAVGSLLVLAGLHQWSDMFVAKACGAYQDLLGPMLVGSLFGGATIEGQQAAEFYCGLLRGFVQGLIICGFTAAFVGIWFLVVRSWPATEERRS
jgi:hypothetical protein